MQLATVNDYLALAHKVAQLTREHKFLVGITNVEGKIALYGRNDSAVNTLIEARTDYPKGAVVHESDYLDPATVAAMRRDAMRGDPVAQALRSLGEQKPAHGPASPIILT